MTSPGVRRIIPLTFGWQHLPKSVSVLATTTMPAVSGSSPAARRCTCSGPSSTWVWPRARVWRTAPCTASTTTNPRIDWRLADGDGELAPGITAVATSGHMAGHQSFVVDLDGGGGFVFAFDAADLQENLDDERSPGYVVDDDTAAAIESIRRLEALAAEKGYRVIPGHDPDVWPAFTAELGGPDLEP